MSNGELPLRKLREATVNEGTESDEKNERRRSLLTTVMSDLKSIHSSLASSRL